MMRALEEHLAAWMKGQLDALAAQSGLFGAVRTVAGALDLPAGPPLGANDVGVLVKVERITPAPENRDLGPAPVTEGAALHLSARIALRILGDDEVLSSAAGREVLPAGAHLHRTDLAALTLLALLRERPGPAPDVAAPPGLEAVQGERPQGAATAAQGSRKAHLYWTAFEPGEATVEPKNAKGLRQWDIPLTAACTFRLSPAELEGGRILQIAQQMAAAHQSLDVVIYAGADAIPLDHFTGLSDPVLVELGEHGLTTLGDLARLGEVRVSELAAELRTASAAEQDKLGDLAEMGVLRHSFASPAIVHADPEMLALPARALLAPTAAELTILGRVVNTPEISAAVAVVAVPVAFALTPDTREKVRVGTLLARGR